MLAEWTSEILSLSLSPDPSEKLGQSTALRLVQKVSNRGDMTLEKITMLLLGICVS